MTARSIRVVAVLLVAGCGGPNYLFSGTAQTPKPPSCQFEIVMIPPSKPYREIGTIQFNRDGFTQGTNDRAQFEQEIRPAMCKAGADGVIAMVNSGGWYISGAVFVYQAQPAAAN